METFGLKIIASDRVFYEGRCLSLGTGRREGDPPSP